MFLKRRPSSAVLSAAWRLTKIKNNHLHDEKYRPIHSVKSLEMDNYSWRSCFPIVFAFEHGSDPRANPTLYARRSRGGDENDGCDITARRVDDHDRSRIVLASNKHTALLYGVAVVVLLGFLAKPNVSGPFL